MRETILKIANLWPAYYKGVTEDKDHEAYKLLIHELPLAISALNEQYKFLTTGSSGGAGNITRGPWAATYDTRITSKPTEGYYVVFLFSVDMQSLVLELGLGTTQFTNFYGNSKGALEKIRGAAQQLQVVSDPLLHLNCSEGFADRVSREPANLMVGPRDQLQKSYEQSSIYHLSYQLNNLPSNDQLSADYHEMIKLYQGLVTNRSTPTVDELLEVSFVPSQVAKVASYFEVKPFQPRIIKTGKSRSGGGHRYSKNSTQIGDLGELKVMAYEKEKLIKAGLEHLVCQIVHEEAEGNRPGWDISSFNENGEPILIEVKSSVSSSINQLDITYNEWNAAKANAKNYYIYLVTDIRAKGTINIEVLHNPSSMVDEGVFNIKPNAYILKLFN